MPSKKKKKEGTHASRAKILNKALCVLFHANFMRKGMNPSFLYTDMPMPMPLHHEQDTTQGQF